MIDELDGVAIIAIRNARKFYGIECVPDGIFFFFSKALIIHDATIKTDFLEHLRYYRLVRRQGSGLFCFYLGFIKPLLVSKLIVFIDKACQPLVNFNPVVAFTF